MGYYSTYEGKYMPVGELTMEQEKKIFEWFFTRFGKTYAVVGNYMSYNKRIVVDETDGNFYTGDIYFNPVDSSVSPVLFEMKGYRFEYQLVEFVRFAKSIGVEYHGEVLRTGEDRDDVCKYVIEGDKVMMYKAKRTFDESNCYEVTMDEREYERVLRKLI